MTTDIGQANTDTTFFLDVPDLFHPLPLGSDAAELDEQLNAMADELMPDGGEDRHRIWAEFSKAVMGALLEGDTRYAALCCERDGEGVSPGALVVAVPQLSFDDPKVAAAGIVQVLGSGPGADDARVLDLPCGPAAAIVRERRLQLPDPVEMGLSADDDSGATPSDGDAARTLAMREAQMYIPYQPWQRMVTITISTPALNDWDAYARIFIRIGRSVRFDAAEPRPSAR